ncbi:hypothetical protein Q3C01_08595 [Bradyrhizobium sp. UFLA05-109]
MGPETHDHDPVRAERIPATKYDAQFLDKLKAQQKVAPVDENWTDDQLRSLPPNISWLLYPNGDLQRL